MKLPPYRVTLSIFLVITIIIAAILAQLPMSIQIGLSLAILFLSVFIWIVRDDQDTRLALMFISAMTAMRYLVWRLLESLNFDSVGNTVFSLALFGAETYSIFMMMGFYIHTFKLDRSVDDEPDDPSFRPSVDVFITTFNENIDIVRRTACGALAIKWPNKLVYILDDGNRPEIKQLAEDIGCHYITRSSNRHAKAGNINNALGQTGGEFILFLDADHIPVSTFLERTIHYFKDAKVALVQTPHRFLNPGPVERNLYMEQVMPGEQQLFYQVVQVGKNHWNASFFCGSAGIMRRSALLEVGGIGTETVTEDCETSIKLHGLGYKSIYFSVPQVASLSPESFVGYIIQQTRWARGSMQLLRLYNPLTYPGLTLGQRFCYTHGLSHYFFGIPRIIYYLAPILFIFFNLRPVRVSFLDYLLMALPYLMLSMLANNRIFTKFRYTFWSDVYDACLAPFVAIASTLGIIGPKRARFMVTPKGCQTNHLMFDLSLSWPNLTFCLLSATAMIVGIVRFLTTANSALKESLLINIFWSLYNFMILTAATLSAVERPHTRRAHRVTKAIPVSLKVDGKEFAANSIDLTEFGALVALSEPEAIAERGQLVEFTLEVHGSGLKSIPSTVRRVRVSADKAQLVAVDFADQRPETLKEIIPAIYSAPGIWEYFPEGEDDIFKSWERVLTTPFRWLKNTVPQNLASRLLRGLKGQETHKQEITQKDL